MYVRYALEKDKEQILTLYQDYKNSFAGPELTQSFFPVDLIYVLVEHGINPLSDWVLGYAYVPLGEVRQIVSTRPGGGTMLLEVLPKALKAWVSIRNTSSLNLFIRNGFRVYSYYEAYIPEKGRNSTWLIFERKTHFTI